jgi:hypothetical protein
MPEKQPPKHETLRRRLETQGAFKEGCRAQRHESAVSKLVTQNLQQAKLREKMKRIRQGMKPTGKSSDESESTNESASSSFSFSEL